MRVITGSARGRRLQTLEGDSTRPTAEAVKEAVFSVLQFRIEGRSVLDLFAGSGQLGIEALSRGAKKAVFVDDNREAVAIIEQNVYNCGFSEQAEICRNDFKGFFTRSRGPFDIVFLDPPYRGKMMEDALRLVSARMNPGGTIVCEHLTEEVLPDSAGTFSKGRTYKYGKTSVTYYSAEQPPEKKD